MTFKELNHEDVLDLLPKRDPYAHKGNFGKLLLLCGSKGYTGAAALAAMGALRAGAGLVYLGVPECIYQIEAVKLLEPIVLPLPDQNGMLSCEAINELVTLLPKMDVVLVGPGLGQSEDTYLVVRWILENFCGPVVLDADGINVLETHKDVLRERTGPTILTPHAGEFERIGGDLSITRCDAAVALARDLHITVVLKGHETVITNGECGYVNPTGNPGMAVGGSGDVLAGMLAGLLGQNIPVLEAAACAAWLHGAAGDICEREIGQYAMLPSDLLDVLPRLMK